MSNEFTAEQQAVLRQSADRIFFSDYYEEADEEDVSGDSEYSWNLYTQTNECEDWDQQDGTWGPVGYVDQGDGLTDTYVDYDDYEYQQALYL